MEPAPFGPGDHFEHTALIAAAKAGDAEAALSLALELLPFDTVDTEDAAALLQPYCAEQLVATPVSSRVNSVKNDDPECVAPVKGGGKSALVHFYPECHT